MLIYARNQSQLGATGFQESCAGADANFFQSFEAIRNKRGTYHQEFSDAASGELGQFVIGERLEPGMAAQTGLKGEGILISGHAGLFDKRSHRFETLGAITGG